MCVDLQQIRKRLLEAKVVSISQSCRYRFMIWHWMTWFTKTKNHGKDTMIYKPAIIFMCLNSYWESFFEFCIAFRSKRLYILLPSKLRTNMRRSISYKQPVKMPPRIFFSKWCVLILYKISNLPVMKRPALFISVENCHTWKMESRHFQNYFLSSHVSTAKLNSRNSSLVLVWDT